MPPGKPAGRSGHRYCGRNAGPRTGAPSDFCVGRRTVCQRPGASSPKQPAPGAHRGVAQAARRLVWVVEPKSPTASAGPSQKVASDPQSCANFYIYISYSYDRFLGASEDFLRMMLTPAGVFYLFGPCPGQTLLRRPSRATPSDQTRSSHREVPVERRCFGLRRIRGGRFRALCSLTFEYGRKGNAGGGVLADGSILETGLVRRQDSGRSAFHKPSQGACCGRVTGYEVRLM